MSHKLYSTTDFYGGKWLILKHWAMNPKFPTDWKIKFLKFLCFRNVRCANMDFKCVAKKNKNRQIDKDLKSIGHSLILLSDAKTGLSDLLWNYLYGPGEF